MKTVFQGVAAVLLSQRDAGEMAAVTPVFTGQARGESVPLDGGNKNGEAELSGTREEDADSQECNNLYALQVGTHSPLDARGRRRHQPQAHVSL